VKVELLHDWDEYKKGQSYEVSEELGHRLIGAGSVRVIEIRPADVVAAEAATKPKGKVK
jgi:hypothetical protein